MSGVSERLGDICYKIGSMITSIKTGRPTRFEKEIRIGAIVNGIFRDDPAIRPGWAIGETIRTGKSVVVQNYYAAQIRRKIVFTDDSTSIMV